MGITKGMFVGMCYRGNQRVDSNLIKFCIKFSVRKISVNFVYGRNRLLFQNVGDFKNFNSGIGIF